MKRTVALFEVVVVVAALCVPACLGYSWWNRVAAGGQPRPVLLAQAVPFAAPPRNSGTAPYPAPAQAGVPVPAPSGAAAPAASGVAVSGGAAAVVFAPSSDREPFLSPEEAVSLRDEERRRKIMAQREEQESRRRAAEELLNSRPGAKIIVQGIIGKQAIVNDKVVGVGAKVMGARITRIGSNFVDFDEDGVTFRKKLKGQ
ncbi:MAG: hypothetical protein PHP45_05495 [Elusimicrobiales bacterium]|nr:hypothetical protein [Elusimicrobiales bacterium]